jgi:hypothetical protein
MYALPRILRRDENRVVSSFLPSAFLVLYTVGILFLVNTAHAGGRLVHEFGIHAILPSQATQPAMPELSSESNEHPIAIAEKSGRGN